MHLQSNTLMVVTAVLTTCPAVAEDWPMFGGSPTCNPVSREKNPPILRAAGGDYDPQTNRWVEDRSQRQNIQWTARLGSQTYGTPVIANRQVYIGTNNAGGYLKRYPVDVDLGVLLCFRESDGEFLWQYSREKHPAGRVHDWPLQGLGASPLVEGERLWFINNCWELICADTLGFHDQENDGPCQDEPVSELQEADVIWKLDLIKELGVHPHCAGMGPDRRSSLASWQNRLYFLTGNGVDETHLNLPAPAAPSLACVDRETGKVLWTDRSPGKNILHTQIGSPLVAEIQGRVQVIAPQGDGWVRSFDSLTGQLIWEFDLNFKQSPWKIGGAGTRNYILATPVLAENRIFIASGQEPEHGEGMGRLVCLDPTRTGDISSELAVDPKGATIPHRRLQAVDPAQGERAIPNPNSGVVWEFGARSQEESDKLKFEEQMHRTCSSVAVHQGLVIAADSSGLIHCLDAGTGKRHWSHDSLSWLIGAPLIVDNLVYVGDEDGEVTIFRLSEKLEILAEITLDSSIYASPVYANGTLYLATKRMLYAIAREQQPEQERVQGNWPQWRGPNRDNASTETGLLPTWPEAGPPLLWQLQGLGTGIASLAVSEGKIFTLGYHGDSELALALDERTGQLVWAARIGPAVSESRLMRWLAQRTPTIDRDRAYFVTYSGELVCLLTATGKELWRKKSIEDFGATTNPWGLPDYPLVDGDKLLFSPCGTKATIVALEKRTGKVLWQTLVPGRSHHGYAAMVAGQGGGVPQYVVFLPDALVGVSASDGQLLWKYSAVSNPTANSHTPLVWEDYVLCSSGYGGQVELLQLETRDKAWHARSLYQLPLARDPFTDPLVRSGELAYSRTAQTLSCFDWKTGELRWTQQTGPGKASQTLADGRLYLLHSNGAVVQVKAQAEGYEETGRFSLPDVQDAIGATNPVVAGGRLYLRDDDRLFCFNIRQGVRQQQTPAPNQIILTKEMIAKAGPVAPEDPRNDPSRIPKSVFVPTPQDVVEKMLELAKVRKEDQVYDLGSGDGRILIRAAAKYGCRAVGYELDPDLVKLSRQQIREARVELLVTIHQADLFSADLSQANVVMLYLLPTQLEKLIPQLEKLPAGARIVSHQFSIPGVKIEQTVTVESKESGEKHTLYLWNTPLKAMQE